jgi:hypothetical protein
MMQSLHKPVSFMFATLKSGALLSRDSDIPVTVQRHLPVGLGYPTEFQQGGIDIPPGVKTLNAGMPSYQLAAYRPAY